MVDLNLLDEVLVFLKKRGESGFSFSSGSIYLSKEKDKYLPSALDKLIKDGFAYTKVGKTYTQYFITFDGLIALDECNSKPYKAKKESEKRKKCWERVKLFAVLVNALIVLLFTILTFIYKD